MDECQLLLEEVATYGLKKDYVDLWKGVATFYSALVEENGNVINDFWKPVRFCLNSLRIKKIRAYEYRKYLCEFHDANDKRCFVVLSFGFIFKHLKEV